MDAQWNLSSETGKIIVIVATIELFIEIALGVIILVVLRWPVDPVTIAILIFPALMFGACILYLILKDQKEERPVNEALWEN